MFKKTTKAAKEDQPQVCNVKFTVLYILTSKHHIKRRSLRSQKKKNVFQVAFF